MNLPTPPEHISKCQGQCPQCMSEDVEYEAMELQDNNVYYPIICHECHYEGKEWYELKYIESV